MVQGHAPAVARILGVRAGQAVLPVSQVREGVVGRIDEH